jgi:hypothetical protein
MPKPTLASAALFTPLGFLALTGLFAGAVGGLVSAGASPEAAGFVALVLVMGTGEAILHALNATVHRTMGIPARRRAVAKAQVNAQTAAQDPEA